MLLLTEVSKVSVPGLRRGRFASVLKPTVILSLATEGGLARVLESLFSPLGT